MPLVARVRADGGPRGAAENAHDAPAASAEDTTPSTDDDADGSNDNDRSTEGGSRSSARSKRRPTRFERLILTGTFFTSLFIDIYHRPFRFCVPLVRRSNLALTVQGAWTFFAVWVLMSTWLGSTNKAPLLSFFCGWAWMLHAVFLTVSLVGLWYPDFQFWFHHWFSSMASGVAVLAALSLWAEGRTPTALLMDADNEVLQYLLPDQLFSWGSALVLGGPVVATQLFFWADLDSHAVNLYENGLLVNKVDRANHWVYMLIAPLGPTALWFVFFRPVVPLMTDLDLWPTAWVLGTALIAANAPWMLAAMHKGTRWVGWPMYIDGGRGWIIQVCLQGAPSTADGNATWQSTAPVRPGKTAPNGASNQDTRSADTMPGGSCVEATHAGGLAQGACHLRSRASDEPFVADLD